jgi:hypothetical protein
MSQEFQERAKTWLEALDTVTSFEKHVLSYAIKVPRFERCKYADEEAYPEGQFCWFKHGSELQMCKNEDFAGGKCPRNDCYFQHKNHSFRTFWDEGYAVTPSNLREILHEDGYNKPLWKYL